MGNPIGKRTDRLNGASTGSWWQVKGRRDRREVVGEEGVDSGGGEIEER